MADHLALPVHPRQLMQMPARPADVRECSGIGDGERAGASPIAGLNAFCDREGGTRYAAAAEVERDRFHGSVGADVDDVPRRDVPAIGALAHDSRPLATR